MLGATDGVRRPALADIPTAQLDQTNVLEAAERFRRTFEDESIPTDRWAGNLRSVTDPTFAASLPDAERGYFAAKKSATVKVTKRYTMGSPQPYATVTAYDKERNPMWHARLTITPSAADPSIGTWRVSALDWDDETLAGTKTIPLTEEARDNLRVTAAFASAGVITQTKGESPQDRPAFLQKYLSAPTKAAARGKPLPRQNVTTVANNPDSTYFVTPQGDKSVWVEVNGSFSVLNDEGTRGKPQRLTMYVELEHTPDGFIARDVYSSDQFHAATKH